MSVCICSYSMYLLCSFFFFFWLSYAACGILDPQPGMEPNHLHWKHSVLTTGLPGELLGLFSYVLLVASKAVYFFTHLFLILSSVL